jgi:hypothetical protein
MCGLRRDELDCVCIFLKSHQPLFSLLFISQQQQVGALLKWGAKTLFLHISMECKNFVFT